MNSIIVGTAGHIDHGKTALIRALTGIETDRLEEEKRRGISIDLGFAHLETGDARIGFVDVPGHERFIKNMLAGAGGIDAVLLVIAADESIKPQTREHFEICRLLGVRAGIVVLTKADLVEPELVDLVRLEAEEMVEGSFLAGAPVVAVSSVTGQGLDQLRAAIDGLARTVASRGSGGYLRLPVDRSFAMRGFGTVVTGTMVSGSVSVDQEVEAQPGGRRYRVRGVQVHGSAAARAVAGERTALNLAAADASELGRGITIAERGRFEAVTVADCELNLLGSAKPLKHGAPVHFHAWTAETEARVRVLDGAAVPPGGRALVRLRLREPVLLLPGDRFIVRMFSPVATIGGGRVLDIRPPERQKRVRAVERLAALETAGGRIALLVRESGAGMSMAALVARTGMTEREIANASAGMMHLAGSGWFVDPEWLDGRARAIEERVAAHHRANPVLPGMPKEEARSREMGQAPEFLFDTVLERTRGLVADGDVLRLASHKVKFDRDEQDAVAAIEQLFEKAGLAVPATAEVLSQCALPEARARSLLQSLIRSGRLIRVSDTLVFHAAAIGRLREAIAARKGTRFSVTEFKDWTGVSRKYAIPLLEFLDREKRTRRDGDTRVAL